MIGFLLFVVVVVDVIIFGYCDFRRSPSPSFFCFNVLYILIYWKHPTYLLIPFLSTDRWDTSGKRVAHIGICFCDEDFFVIDCVSCAQPYLPCLVQDPALREVNRWLYNLIECCRLVLLVPPSVVNVWRLCGLVSCFNSLFARHSSFPRLKGNRAIEQWSYISSLISFESLILLLLLSF